MNDKNTDENRRKVIGKILTKLRTVKKESIYRISQRSGLKIDQVNAIEAGSKNYTVDSLTAYILALDLTLLELSEVITITLLDPVPLSRAKKKS